MQENSNEDPSLSNSEAPAKAKRNPQKGILHQRDKFDVAYNFYVDPN